MPRFRRSLTFFLLLTLLALPALAVPSSRTNQNRAWSFFSALWSTFTSLFRADSTDGRCGLDPDGRCLPGATMDQRGTIDPAG